MTTDPPHWLSWASDIAGVIGLLALVGVPLHKWLSPGVKRWQALKTHEGRRKRLAYLHRRLAYVDRLAERPSLAVLIVLRHILFAASSVAGSYMIESICRQFAWVNHHVEFYNLRAFGWEGAAVNIFFALGDVDIAIDPSEYRQRALNEINQLQELDEQEK